MSWLLGDAPTDLAGVPKGRTIDLPWTHIEQVHQRQSNRSPDAIRGTVGRPECVEGTRHGQLPTDRAIDDEQDGAATRTRRRSVQQEVLVEHGRHRRDHDRKVRW